MVIRSILADQIVLAKKTLCMVSAKTLVLMLLRFELFYAPVTFLNCGRGLNGIERKLWNRVVEISVANQHL